MDNKFGSDYITLTDDDGNSFELEHLDTIEYNGSLYLAFVPAGEGAEDDPDYGIILLKTIHENDEDILSTIDDADELNSVYEEFMNQLYEDEGYTSE